MSNIIPFTPARSENVAIFADCVLFEGAKRRQWAVMERTGGGTVRCIAIQRSKSSAVLLARILRQERVEKEQARDAINTNHPVWLFFACLSDSDRSLLWNIAAAWHFERREWPKEPDSPS